MAPNSQIIELRFIDPDLSGSTQHLERRKGGGGGGRGGGGSSGGGGIKGGGSSSGSSSSGGRTSSGESSGTRGGSSSSGTGRSSSQPSRPNTYRPPSSVTSGGSSRSASTGSNGGGAKSTIPAGNPFAGREQGGGTRNDVYGTPYYGSGYPGTNNLRGVGGFGFPYYYWPLAFGGAGIGSAAYLHNHEYGNPDNSTRPGGPMMVADFPSNSKNTTLHVIADNSTVVDLIASIRESCASNIASNSSTTPTAYTENNNKTQPESAVQFYRASSVALTMEGYNNTAALGDDQNAPPTPLPDWYDRDLVTCLNSTIGTNVPLVDSAAIMTTPSMGVMGFIALSVMAISRIL